MVIDFHTHIGQISPRGGPLTPEALLRWMDQKGVDKAVLHSLESPEASFHYVLSIDCLNAADRYPDRFIPFVGRDPRAETNREFLAMAAQRGARGFGEVKVPLPIDHPLLLELFAICDEYHWPILLHMDPLRLVDEPGLPRLERLITTFSQAIFVGHAPGFWCHISDDVNAANYGHYNAGPIVPGGVLDRLLSTYPNVYGDVSSGSGFRALTRDIPSGRDFIVRHRTKILFGTDKLSPIIEPRNFELRSILELDDEVWRDLTDTNPRRILNLERQIDRSAHEIAVG